MNKVTIKEVNKLKRKYTVNELLCLLPTITAFIGTSQEGIKGVFLITHCCIVCAYDPQIIFICDWMTFYVDKFIDVEIKEI